MSNDSIGSPAGPRLVVPCSPMSPVQCCAHACGHPSRFSLRPPTCSPNSIHQPLDDRRELGLGGSDGVVAMRIADASDRRRVKPVRFERKTDRADLRDHIVELRGRNTGDDEILAAREADIAAERRRQRRNLAHLPPAHQAEVNREADVVEPRLLLLVDAHVIALGLGERHLGEIIEREAELALRPACEIPRGRSRRS